MLTTLAYRIPREHLGAVLGSVTAYPLTEDFASAWSNLPGERPTYRTLTTGLVAATGKPVRMFGERKLGGRDTALGAKALLLTTDSALDNRLRVAVRAWESHLRNGGPPVLAELLPEPESERSFGDFVEYVPGRAPGAPPWVFRVAAWQVARLLAAKPMQVDDRAIRLRTDTEGRLVAWDDRDLVRSTSGKAVSLANVTMRLVTRPGVDDLVLTFDAHLSRLDPQARWYRSAWVEREPDTPIAYLPVLGRRVGSEERYVHFFDPAFAAVLAACQLRPLDAPDADGEMSGTFRPKLKSADFHTLGSGLGPRFIARLHDHIIAQLPLLEPLEYVEDPEIKLPTRVAKYPAGGLTPAAIGATGAKKLTIACLYRTAEARDRMFAELDELTGVRPAGGELPTVVHERLEVIARHCPALLDHETPNRAAELAALDLPADPETLVAAWVETEFHAVAPPRDVDAKPHLRRLLAHRGVPSQFLATEPAVLPAGTRPASPGSQKHAARAALRDLLRSCGVLDERIRIAVARENLKNRLNRRTLLVGIGARAQQTYDGRNVFVLVLTAVLADPEHLEHWRVLMYSERQRRWVRAADGLTGFHAGTIGSLGLGRYGSQAEVTRDEVERRLQDLVTGDLAALPVVVFVQAQATRTVWSGLQNSLLGAGDLPGDTLAADGADVAVVRSHADMGDLGRPVTRFGEHHLPDDKRQPAAPGRKVYRLAGTAVPSWLFAGTSVTLGSKNGRVGTLYTRWNLPENLRKELGVPWHAYTSREFVVARAGSWKPVELAALAARLCEQPIAWDGRTLTPSPLHLGITADKDHPDYRIRGQDD